MKSLPRLILLFMGFCLSSMATEADDVIVKEYDGLHYVPKLSINHAKRNSVEFGLIRLNSGIRLQIFTSPRRKNNNNANSDLLNPFEYIAYLNHGPYTSVEIFKTDDGDVSYAPKIGYELAQAAPTFATFLAVELKYYDSNYFDGGMVFSPKIGIPLGFFSLHYSRNYADDDIVRYMGEHVVSVSYNMDLKARKEFRKMFLFWRNRR